MNIKESLDIYFKLIEDPISKAHITYELSDILFMLVIGMLCSCTDLDMIIEFAEEKIEFLRKYTQHDVKRKTIIGNMRKCLLNEQYLEDVLKYYCHTQI